MATHELLENSARYSLKDQALLSISATRLPDDFLVEVRTGNHATPENAKRGEEIIKRISDAPDPFELYQEVMIEAAEREHGSGLGLVRIRAEGNMKLSSAYSKGKLSIHAQVRLPVPTELRDQ